MTIPPGIQKAAELAVFAFEARIQGGEFEGLDPNGTEARDALKAEIAKALADERERGARIAEGFEQTRDRDWCPGSLYDNIRREVAAAIRNPNSRAIPNPAN